MTRPASRVYKTLVRVVKLSDSHLKVISDPHPIHTAHVQLQASGAWKVTLPTMPLSRSFMDASMSDALNRAGDWVGRAAGIELQRFRPTQRYAMGQQRCPYLLDRYSRKACNGAPEVGTVWCSWHPGGRVAPDA